MNEWNTRQFQDALLDEALAFIDSNATSPNGIDLANCIRNRKTSGMGGLEDGHRH